MGDGRKVRTICVRLEEDTYDTVRERAMEAGYADVSKWVREALCAATVVTEGGGAVPDVIVIDSDTWRRMLVELGRWGTNLNQCTAALNRSRKAIVAAWQDGAVTRDDARLVIDAAKSCQATIEGEGMALRGDILAALEERRASAVAFLQNARAGSGGPDA